MIRHEQEPEPTDTLHLEVPPRGDFVEIVTDFVRTSTSTFRLGETKGMALTRSARTAIEAVIREVGNRRDPATLSIKVQPWPTRVSVSIHNRGIPVFVREEDLERARTHLLQGIDDVELQNLGRDGQLITLSALREPDAPRSLRDISLMQLPDSDIEIRLLGPGEEYELSRLFHSVYGYDYINEFVYYPDKLRSMVDDGRLVCMVAVSDGPEGKRLISHTGMQRLSSDPLVYDGGFGGITNPKVKSRGTFGRCFQAVMDWAAQTSMRYQEFHIVTNHDFTQRRCAVYGVHETALFVGAQSRETQAKLERLGIGVDPEDMDRYSVFKGVLPRCDSPFGKEIHLPENLGEMLGFLLPRLGLTWMPAPRFDQLPKDGEVIATFEETQSSVHFDFVKTGREGLQRILHDWSLHLRDGYEYAAVDIPVKNRGLSQIYEALASHGFFVGGFVPYHHGEELAIRFQTVGPTKVAFNKIHAYSENAQRLLRVIQSDYERNQVL
ncbi:hypothetical protein LZC95_30125 [Pendulispora brunnea]|uniref:N-acetyltransferase domain-containing protein n=1 Tax=Pendulispora brunnea TaxID=2905690 RepID=A0ABZ2K030_9BACT